MIDETKLKEISREVAIKTYLPKWPQCIINGNKITPEQADEIIRRTDRYFYYPHSNDHEFDEKFKELSQSIFDTSYLDAFDDDTSELKEQLLKYENLMDLFYDAWGFIDLNYLNNDFIASCFVDGAHGWCHPDGTIAHYHNIGKWPAVSEVEEDLQKITKEFPFLRLECTLCQKEYCEKKNESIITMIAKNGNVKFYEPVPYDDLEKVCKHYDIDDSWTSHCFSIDHIKEWFDRIDLNKLKEKNND